MIPVSAQETECLPPNRFIEGFIYPTRILTNQLDLVDQELSQEKNSWLQSSAAEELTDLTIAVLAKHGGTTITPPERKNLIRTERVLLYGRIRNRRQAQQADNFQRKVLTQLPQKIKIELTRVGELEKEHALQYNQAVKPLTDQQASLTDNLADQWVKFMAVDYFNFVDFDGFLSAAEYIGLRESSRPLLQALERYRFTQQQDNIDILGSVRTQVLSRTIAHPPGKVFAEFIDVLQKKSDSAKGGYESRNTLDWLKFSSYPSCEVDPEEIVQRLQVSGIFPVGLRILWVGFLETDLTFHTNKIRQALDTYREQQTIPIGSFQYRTTQKKTSKRHTRIHHHRHKYY